MSLATAANVERALAGLDEANARPHLEQAAALMDEAIALFEATGQWWRLTQAYPDGVRHHEPLAAERPESRDKLLEYASKAAKLLAQYNRHEEAERFAEIARNLGEQEAT